MNPDLLRSEFLGVTVHFDEVDLSRDDLAMFFSEVSGPYDLPRFEFDPEGGATMSHPDGVDVVLRPGSFSCGGVTALGFQQGFHRIEGLVGAVASRYGIDEMWLDDITLVATWEMESPEATREYLAENLLQFDTDRLAAIDGEDLALGLRIWRTLDDGTVDCSIEPMHSDPSRLYIRLVFGTREGPSDLSGVVAAVDRVNEFLRGPILSFMVSVVRPSQ